MSRSSGGGSPLWFKCHGCRKAGRHRTHHDIRLTGRKRSKKPNRGCALGVRSTVSQREYECLTCRHVGWSNHTDLARMAGEDRYA